MQDQSLRLIKAQRWVELRSYLSSPKFSDEVTSFPKISPCTILHVACDIPSVPLDIVVSLLQVFPQAVLVEDEDGNLPIHNVCALVTSRPDLVHLLLNACPETSFVPSREGQELPFYLLMSHCVQNKGLKNALDLLTSLPPTLIYNDEVSVLHQVCNCLLPEAICHKIVDLYPNICKISNKGSTLLHIMCSHRNSTPSVIEKVISICPENCAMQDENGNLPLHLVNSQQHSLEIMRILMGHDPSALLVQNSSGQIPLVSSFIRSSSRKVKELLRFCTSSADNVSANAMLQIKNQYGMLPLQEYYYALQGEITSQVLKGMISLDNLASFGKMQSYNRLLANNLESFFYLMRVAVYNDVEYALEAPHQSSFWATFPIFTKALLHHSPELACHKDFDGNLPLHIISKHEFKQLNSAQCYFCDSGISGPYLWTSHKINCCKSCCHSGRANSHYFQSCLIEYQGNELLKDVLAVNPLAANVKDADGNLPLHLCLKSAKSWTTGIKELVEAAPFALGAIDGETNMFPFMLAAEGKVSDEMLNPGQKLSTVYELLRRGPSLL